MKLFYSILALTIILASCGTSNSVTSNHFLQKRKHTSGWHFNNQKREVFSNMESKRENVTADASLNSTINLKESTSDLIELKFAVQAECDTIILNDGKIVRAKIISTSDSTIHYTKCDSEDQTELILAKEEVKALQYANGKFEFVKHQSAAEVNKSELKEQKAAQKEKKLKNKKSRIIWIWSIVTIVIVGGIVSFIVAWNNGWG